MLNKTDLVFTMTYETASWNFSPLIINEFESLGNSRYTTNKEARGKEAQWRMKK